MLVLCAVTGNKLNRPVVLLKWDSQPDYIVAHFNQLNIIFRDICIGSRLLEERLRLFQESRLYILRGILNAEYRGRSECADGCSKHRRHLELRGAIVGLLLLGHHPKLPAALREIILPVRNRFVEVTRFGCFVVF